jgi:hypothetical protein
VLKRKKIALFILSKFNELCLTSMFVRISITVGFKNLRNRRN